MLCFGWLWDINLLLHLQNVFLQEHIGETVKYQNMVGKCIVIYNPRYTQFGM
jgi:hypothetical protein